MASALSKCARICKHSQKGLLRPLVHQRFGSSHSNDPKLPEEFVFEEPAFLFGDMLKPFFKEVHPVTRWIAYNMESEEESLRKNTIVIREAQERARRRLIDLEPRKNL
ncbi:hypothetical protein DSO57_1038931 [Entomophthora muscae]|uniref:Uncharacterized protein n=1 Tax=Entomophthora muscae TaxID=34485 RepID=A0ACC2UIL8_9FUNG|nr:hypothetical protein DSO57_1038931 [Entomophthora muscae]